MGRKAPQLMFIVRIQCYQEFWDSFQCWYPCVFEWWLWLEPQISSTGARFSNELQKLDWIAGCQYSSLSNSCRVALYNGVIMGTMASQITSLTIVYSTVYSGADQRKHQSSASLAFVGNSPGTGEFPAQIASNAANVSIWWRHHDTDWYLSHRLRIIPWDECHETSPMISQHWFK